MLINPMMHPLAIGIFIVEARIDLFDGPENTPFLGLVRITGARSCLIEIQIIFQATTEAVVEPCTSELSLVFEIGRTTKAQFTPRVKGG